MVLEADLQKFKQLPDLIICGLMCEYSHVWFTIGLGNYRFTMQNTITEDKFTNTFVSGDVMTGDAPTARTGHPGRPSM